MPIALADLATRAPSVVAHPGGGWSGGPGWLVLLVPLLWFVLFVVVVALIGRRWRHGGPPWASARQAAPSAAAEGVLAQRFANGDIDEVEYRARLEVLRASRPPVG
jgi:putative membrane protein